MKRPVTDPSKQKKNQKYLIGFTAFAARPRSTDRLINPSIRCSTWRGNDLTKLNRQAQLWVCPRFEPPTPHLCISYTGREPEADFLNVCFAHCSYLGTSSAILNDSVIKKMKNREILKKFL